MLLKLKTKSNMGRMFEINEGDNSEKMMEYAEKAYKYTKKLLECLEEEGLGERYDDDDFDDNFGERGGSSGSGGGMGQRRGVRGTGRYSRYR